MNTHKQPKPFNNNWNRYCPQQPFPPYRHLPGVTPHPIRDPLGHSYGIEEEENENPLPPEMWQQNEAYLHGVDLYNFSYWWEAHEAWEGLWHQAEDTYRLFLQGLIQVSASHTTCECCDHYALSPPQDAINYTKLFLNVAMQTRTIWV